MIISKFMQKSMVGVGTMCSWEPARQTKKAFYASQAEIPIRELSHGPKL